MRCEAKRKRIRKSHRKSVRVLLTGKNRTGALVSKYIGETEKNLRRVFAAAKKNGAVLFFDEVDALFGKRTELKDSHDRYVNIEINYLLQRIEKYGGVAILAAGNRTKIDNALSQWFHFVIRVPPRRKSRRSALAM